MRLSEQEFIDLMGKKKVIRLILPIPLPTWNALLAMGWRQRKQVRDAVHQMVELVVSTSTACVDTLPTQTVYRLKQSLTDYAMSDYLKTITPSSSRKLASRKRGQKLMKQLST